MFSGYDTVSANVWCFLSVATISTKPPKHKTKIKVNSGFSAGKTITQP